MTTLRETTGFEMKQFLKEAPLVQAIIHLRISQHPDLTNPSEAIAGALHKRMTKEGFPERIDTEATTLEFNFTSADKQLNQNSSSVKGISFRAPGEKDIILITHQNIVLKTTDYSCFEDFSGTFRRILEALIDSVPDFDKVLLKSASIRYVDLIVPKQGSKLEDYVSKDLLPMSLPMLEHSTSLHSATVNQVATNQLQIMTVKFEEIPCPDGKIQRVMPNDLIEQDPRCALRISGQKDWFSLSSPSYGMLDVDHLHSFDASPQFDLDLISKTVKSLYDDTSKVFWGAITETAKEAWQISEMKV